MLTLFFLTCSTFQHSFTEERKDRGLESPSSLPATRDDIKHVSPTVQQRKNLGALLTWEQTVVYTTLSKPVSLSSPQMWWLVLCLNSASSTVAPQLAVQILLIQKW